MNTANPDHLNLENPFKGIELRTKKGHLMQLGESFFAYPCIAITAKDELDLPIRSTILSYLNNMLCNSSVYRKINDLPYSDKSQDRYWGSLVNETNKHFRKTFGFNKNIMSRNGCVLLFDLHVLREYISLEYFLGYARLLGK